MRARNLSCSGMKGGKRSFAALTTKVRSAGQTGLVQLQFSLTQHFLAHSASLSRLCSSCHRSRRLLRYEMANGRTARQGKSHVDALCDAQSILKFHAKVANGAVDLGVTEQKLHRAEVSGLSINLCCLCSSK